MASTNLNHVDEQDVAAPRPKRRRVRAGAACARCRSDHKACNSEVRPCPRCAHLGDTEAAECAKSVSNLLRNNGSTTSTTTTTRKTTACATRKAAAAATAMNTTLPSLNSLSGLQAFGQSTTPTLAALPPFVPTYSDPRNALSSLPFSQQLVTEIPIMSQSRWEEVEGERDKRAREEKRRRQREEWERERERNEREKEWKIQKKRKRKESAEQMHSVLASVLNEVRQLTAVADELKREQVHFAHQLQAREEQLQTTSLPAKPSAIEYYPQHVTPYLNLQQNTQQHTQQQQPTQQQHKQQIFSQQQRIQTQQNTQQLQSPSNASSPDVSSPLLPFSAIPDHLKRLQQHSEWNDSSSSSGPSSPSPPSSSSSSSSSPPLSMSSSWNYTDDDFPIPELGSFEALVSGITNEGEREQQTKEVALVSSSVARPMPFVPFVINDDSKPFAILRPIFTRSADSSNPFPLRFELVQGMYGPEIRPTLRMEVASPASSKLFLYSQDELTTVNPPILVPAFQHRFRRGVPFIWGKSKEMVSPVISFAPVFRDKDGSLLDVRSRSQFFYREDGYLSFFICVIDRVVRRLQPPPHVQNTIAQGISARITTLSPNNMHISPASQHNNTMKSIEAAVALETKKTTRVVACR